MLISEIRDDVITEVGGDTTDTELQTKMLGFIKASLRRFPRWCRGRLLRTTKSGSLTAAATTMSLPSGTRQVFQVYYLDSSSNKRIDIPQAKSPQEFNEAFRGTETGTPELFIIRGATVEFNRKNDATRTIYFEAQGEISSVVAGDTWAYTEDDVEIVKDGAKFYYYTYKEDETQQVFFGGLFKDSLAKIDAEYVREQMPDHVEEAE